MLGALPLAIGDWLFTKWTVNRGLCRLPTQDSGYPGTTSSLDYPDYLACLMVIESRN